MKTFKALIEYKPNKTRIVKVKAKNIDSVEKVINKSYPNTIPVIIADEKAMSNKDMHEKYFYINLLSYFYRLKGNNHVMEPLYISRKSFKYKTYPTSFVTFDIGGVIVSVNDKYILLNPKMPYKDIDIYITKEYNEEVYDIKSIVFDKNFKNVLLNWYKLV